MKTDTKTLAGTAILAALVFVFDYSMKISNTKIIYPWLPALRFDFTGIPIVISLCLFGFLPGVFTSVIALVAILVRSGQVIPSSMKATAELSTVVGIAFALKVTPKFKKTASVASGILTRCFVMFFPNLFLFPLEISPLIALFNAIQGSISILGGFFIYEALKRRIPSLISKTLTQIDLKTVDKHNQTQSLRKCASKLPGK